MLKIDQIGFWPRFGAGITASKFQMYNTPCQGTGADLIKLVMAEVKIMKSLAG